MKKHLFEDDKSNQLSLIKKPRLLVVSHVLPFPGTAGQQQRVFYKLEALNEYFHITFVTVAPPSSLPYVREKLLSYCDDVIVHPSIYSRLFINRIWYQLVAIVYSLRTSLKRSNYVIGELEFSSTRLQLMLGTRDFDCVLYEYWHAAKSISNFQRKGIPCILDTHNILWQSKRRQLNSWSILPDWLKKWSVNRYKRREEYAWAQFDGLIAINRKEYEYIKTHVPDNVNMFYAPMGIDLTRWPYSWQPVSPPRLAYYGGLGSSHNQKDALYCYEQVMPVIWRVYPQVELWLVGSNPPKSLQDLAKDRRVKVTGYVGLVQDILKTMTAVLCPWTGQYGFRSRLVEVMALGVPVVASSQAVYGMDMQTSKGIFLEDTPGGMARASLDLLNDADFARRQSRLATRQTAEKFSFETTYGLLADEFLAFVLSKRKPAPPD